MMRSAITTAVALGLVGILVATCLAPRPASSFTPTAYAPLPTSAFLPINPLVRPIHVDPTPRPTPKPTPRTQVHGVVGPSTNNGIDVLATEGESQP